MKNLLVVIMLMFSANTLFAQIQFRQGYVITINGDTLFGEIDYQDNDVLARQCRFRESPQSQSQIFSPFDIAGYRFTDGKYFISKNIDNTQYFVEYLLNGVINLYTLHDETKATHFYIEKEGIGFKEVPYEDKVLSEYQGTIFHGNTESFKRDYAYSTTKHIGILQYFMQDAGKLNNRIAAIKEPTRRNMLKLAESYHNIVCDSVSCIIYEKKLPRVRFNPQLVFGATYYSFDKISNENVFLPTYGLLCHISLPYINNRMYIKTGILSHSNKNKHSLWVPFHVEYLYPTGVVRPRISAGFGFPKFDPTISGGLWFMVHKNISITADYDLSIINILKPANTKYLSHILYAGIRVDI
jgi:hypothetical protein